MFPVELVYILTGMAFLIGFSIALAAVTRKK